MLNDGCPCFYRVVFFCHGFPPQSEQGTSYIWKPYAVRAIGIPGETCPPRAPPGFIFRHPGTSGRIVGLLRFPGDDTVFRSEERRVGKECSSRWWPEQDSNVGASSCHRRSH